MAKISDKFYPGPRARAIFLIVGVCLLSIGIWIHRRHAPGTAADAQSEPAGVLHALPKEVRAQGDSTRAGLDHHGNKHAVTGLSYFSGTWKNAKNGSRGLTTLKVRTAGESVFVRAWGACHPTDCDWGEVPGNAFAPSVATDPASSAQKVTALFETSFSNTLLTLSPTDDDEIQADTQTHFTDNSGRSSYSASYTFRH